MELHVGRRADLLREPGQVGGAPDLLELAAHLELLGHGVEIDRLQLRRKLLDRLVDQAVFLGVKGVGGDELLHGDDAVLFEHQGAEHGLLQFDRLRRDVAAHIDDRLESFAVTCGRGIFFCHGLRVSTSKSRQTHGQIKAARGLSAKTTAGRE
jgi:hypothetical protein